MKGGDIIFVEKTKISIVLITLNEESNIRRCLKSVQWADEIVVYDSGSTDATVQIARNMGATVLVGPWLGFGPTKGKAAGLAKNDWILSLDADEEISTSLAAEIQALPFQADVVYKLPRLSYFLQRWIHHGGWYPDYQGRLFNKLKYNWNHDLVHEKIEATQYVNLTNHLNHYVFRNIEHLVAANNKYSTLLAKKMVASGRRFNYFHFLTKPLVKFLECYFLKIGFLDGWAGFVIARGAAYSVFLKWAKLKEMETAK